MSFKSFAGIILIGIIGLAAATGTNEKKEMPISTIPIEFYEFEEPIYITPPGGSDASLDH